MSALKPTAVRTNCAAGRACSATPAGSVTVVSELVSTACLLCGVDDVLEAAAGGGHDGRRDGALDDRSVDQRGVVVRARVQDMADREDRAAEIAEDDNAVAAVGPADRVAHAALVGAERTVGRAARVLDPDIRAGHLRGELREAGGKLRAM